MADRYEGDVMYHQCLVKPFDFSNTFPITVSGDAWNPCGHLLLNTGGHGGYYFHVAGRKALPRFMRTPNYWRYIVENRKQELIRRRVEVPNPMGAHAKLEELLAKQWRWFVVPNNCATFLEDVVQAGGSKAGLFLFR